MDKTTRDVVDNCVKQIALSRKVAEALDNNVAEFDAELNEMCNNWHKVFADMNEADIAMFMLEDIMAMAKESE